MDYKKLSIEDVILMTPNVIEDDRGYFLETFRQDDFEKNCGKYKFVQENHSKSAKGVLRGLHFQLNSPQGKLVRVINGNIFDVAVDLRKSSNTFGQWVGTYLSEMNKQMLWIPPGFAHGFYVLSDEAEITYKCTDYYQASDQNYLMWNDPTIAIEWPINKIAPYLSERDNDAASLNNVATFV